ncbi:MAG: hypothetical protein Ta2E_11170 [Mycoplasmoidaceae bacterium]|nr:MAG: hypothetical protein Ta2E_11170 [Mycoplasmoidaceae bacterium]
MNVTNDHKVKYIHPYLIHFVVELVSIKYSFNVKAIIDNKKLKEMNIYNKQSQNKKQKSNCYNLMLWAETKLLFKKIKDGFQAIQRTL